MMVKLYTGQEYSINKKLKQQLDILLQNCKYDEMDVVILVTGPEGWGKSFIVRALGRYAATFLGNEFSVPNIHFDLDVYRKTSVRGVQFQINALDEARKALGKAKIKDIRVEKFLDYLSECRKQQQVHIIALPAFHDLKKYIVKWRQQLIIHVVENYVQDDSMPTGIRMKRGEFRVYTSRNDINYCYEHPYDYPKKWEVRDWWSPKDVFSDAEKEAYEAKKDKYTLLKYDDDDNFKSPTKAKRDYRDEILKRMLLDNVSQKDIAKYLGQSTSTISDAKLRLEKRESAQPTPINYTTVSEDGKNEEEVDV